MRTLIIKFLLLVFCSIPALSQTESDRKAVKWNFNFTTGGVIGGPGKDMNKFLINAGYDYNCKTKNRLPFAFSIFRAISGNVGLGLNFNMFYPYLKTGAPFDLCSFRTIAVSPTISYNYKNFIFFDAGPSVNEVFYIHPTGGSLSNNEKYLKPGFTLKSGVEFPKTTRIHLRAEIQYCYGGSINPYFSIENSYRQYIYTTIRADKIPVNYFYFGIGLGLKL
jgi:hypothetical protein